MHVSPVVRIHKLFAEAVFSNYRKRRYGIKNCRIIYDPEYLNDLRELRKRASEMKDCDRELGCGCSLTKIDEKIKTL